MIRMKPVGPASALVVSSWGLRGEHLAEIIHKCPMWHHKGRTSWTPVFFFLLHTKCCIASSFQWLLDGTHTFAQSDAKRPKNTYFNTMWLTLSWCRPLTGSITSADGLSLLYKSNTSDAFPARLPWLKVSGIIAASYCSENFVPRWAQIVSSAPSVFSSLFQIELLAAICTSASLAHLNSPLISFFPAFS